MDKKQHQTTDNSAVIAGLLAQYRHLPGALLPLLHAIQAEIGYVPDAAVASIASGLNLSRAEVHGVISFYHDFSRHPRGKHRLQICRAEACQAMGARELEAQVKQFLGIDYGETTADGNISLEPVYCLGNCACAPSVRIDDHIYARVSLTGFQQLLADLDSAETQS